MNNVFQYLNGLWGHTLTDQVFETEDEAAVSYEAKAREIAYAGYEVEARKRS